MSRFDYESRNAAIDGAISPTFDFRCELLYAADGLVTNYPGITRRSS